jgi:hypothetical protein
MEEIYKDVIGFEGLYMVSNFGNVKNSRGKMLKGCSKKGYIYVHLSKNATYYNYRLNRIVAKAFLPNPNNFTDVNHKDGNKSNNTLDNLEWISHQDNMKHAYANGLLGGFITSGERPNVKLNEEIVKEIKILLKEGNLSQYKIAKKFNVHRGAISSIAYGHSWKDIII